MSGLQTVFLLVVIGLGALVAWQGLSGIFMREVRFQDKLGISIRYTGNKAIAVGAGLIIFGLSLVFIGLSLMTVSPPSASLLALGFVVGLGGLLLCLMISFAVSGTADSERK